MSDQQICRMTKPPRLPPVIFCDMMISTKTYGTLGYNITEQEFILKKKEVLFIAGILVFALVLWGFLAIFRRGDYGTVRITVNGEEYGTYSLAENRKIFINDTNVCEIKDGKVRMIEADCPDHLCMKQPAVGSSGGTIVCLPNKVVIEGEKTADPETDSSAFDAVV